VELLRTERLVLRHWQESDLDAFFDLYSRDEVTRWLGPQPRRALTSAGEARDRLALWRGLEAKLEPPFGLWAMVPLGSGAAEAPPVGTTLLLSLADSGGPTGLTEVGWHLHPEHQGRGLATEGAAAILTAAAAAGIGQVLALTDVDNGPSQAVAARLGMADAGTTDRWFGLTMREFRKDLSRAENHHQ
jgi:RimJ/RimL family protein N-acetyltransferase